MQIKLNFSYPFGRDVTLEMIILRVEVVSLEETREASMLDTNNIVIAVAHSVANFRIIFFVCLNCCSFLLFHFLTIAPLLSQQELCLQSQLLPSSSFNS